MEHAQTDQAFVLERHELKLQLERTLSTMDYPATPDDLLWAAVSDRVSPEGIDALGRLTQSSYDGRYSIFRELEI